MSRPIVFRTVYKAAGTQCVIVGRQFTTLGHVHRRQSLLTIGRRRSLMHHMCRGEIFQVQNYGAVALAERSTIIFEITRISLHTV